MKDLSRCKVVVSYISEDHTCTTIQFAGQILDATAWVAITGGQLHPFWIPATDELRKVVEEGWEIAEDWNRDILAHSTRGFWRRLWRR